MSKYELVALLDGVGIPYEYKGLFDELAYEYYSNFFDEVKTFVNYPRGLGFKVEITDKIDPQVFMQVEDNPMLLFNILNKTFFWLILKENNPLHPVDVSVKCHI